MRPRLASVVASSCFYHPSAGLTTIAPCLCAPILSASPDGVGTPGLGQELVFVPLSPVSPMPGTDLRWGELVSGSQRENDQNNTGMCSLKHFKKL